MDIEITILDPRIELPQYGTEGAAAFDLRACFYGPMITLYPGEKCPFCTGIAMHIKDQRYAGLVVPRSGLGTGGLVIGNLTGLIDSDYQGEIKVQVWNTSEQTITVNPLDRIAQMFIVPVVRAHWKEVKKFSTESVRGAKGHGSTGTK